MKEKFRTNRDFLQNIAITLLSLSAVVLLAQSQFYTLGVSSGVWDLFSPPTVQDGAVSPSASMLSAPVQVAVTSTYGRYGSVTTTTADEEFEPLAQLLGDALGTMGELTDCSAQLYLSALRTPSVFYDFLNPLPLPILANLAHTGSSEAEAARQLLITAGEDSAELFLWDGDSRYLHCTTALSVQALDQVLRYYEMGNAHFAMEFSASHPVTDHFVPSTLLPDQIPALPVLHSAVPHSSENAHLLTALSFNPNTKFRYTDSSGTEVIEENGRTLRLQTDGTIHYQCSTNNSILTIDAANEQPTLLEAASGSGALLRSLLGSAAGESSLYLQSILQSEHSLVLTFGYQVQGIPIRFSDGDSAAVVTLTGSTVSELTLRARQYTSGSSPSLLLPLRQALAVAQAENSASLSIGYADDGSGSVSAGWLTE